MLIQGTLGPDGFRCPGMVAVEMFDRWLRGDMASLGEQTAGDALRPVEALFSFVVLACTIAIDYWTGVDYNPILLYLAVILYISWKSPTRYAPIFLALSLVGMTVAALTDSAFFENAAPALRRVSAMVTVVLMSYALVRLKAVTQSLVEHQRRYAEEQRQRNERQCAFVAALSHEIRTPLNVIAGQAQRLAATKGSIHPDKIEKRTESIIGAVKKIQRLVDAILLSERIDHSQITTHPSLLDFEDMIRRARQRHADAYPDCSIAVLFADAPPIIEADELLIEYVLDNLVANAVKYSPKPGCIEIVGSGDGGRAVVTIRDHGRGIAPDDLPHIFEKYYRGRNVGQVSGFGIGLHLVESIVQMHRGSVEVQSAPGEGTTVIVRLPRSITEAEPKETPL